jgi:hypothetical protein
MAFSVIEFANLAIVHSADVDEVADNDVRAGATTVYYVLANNADAVAKAFLKFYDHAAPTVGTTAPDFCFELELSGGLNSGQVAFPLNPPNGVTFSTGLSFCAVKNVGAADGPGTSGSTAPDSAVGVTIICT